MEGDLHTGIRKQLAGILRRLEFGELGYCSMQKSILCARMVDFTPIAKKHRVVLG